jgi:hypothetical protein
MAAVRTPRSAKRTAAAAASFTEESTRKGTACRDAPHRMHVLSIALLRCPQDTQQRKPPTPMRSTNAGCVPGA